MNRCKVPQRKCLKQLQNTRRPLRDLKPSGIDLTAGVAGVATDVKQLLPELTSLPCETVAVSRHSDIECRSGVARHVMQPGT